MGTLLLRAVVARMEAAITGPLLLRPPRIVMVVPLRTTSRHTLLAQVRMTSRRTHPAARGKGGRLHRTHHARARATEGRSTAPVAMVVGVGLDLGGRL